MYATDPFINELDDLLAGICLKLQITPTQHKLAEDRYISVSKWLSDKSSHFYIANSDIYPQGSLRLGTTVKPLVNQEYDLDLVCEMGLDWNNFDPIQVLDAVESRLKENDSYSKILERKNRCLRLNYANEFHMDVLPAAPDTVRNHGCIKVPDRKAEEWKESNPKGYAEWFERQANQFGEVLAKAKVEPLPDPEDPRGKSTLKYIVQLLKRSRDVAFENDEEVAPISIVLTTLAGIYYRGILSINEAFAYTLHSLTNEISANDTRIVVRNPANQDEDLSERWDNNHKAYNEFVKWVNELSDTWKKLNIVRGPELVKMLQELFGEKVTNDVIKERAEIISRARKEDSLGITKSGLLTTSLASGITQVRPNNFYGD